MPMAIGHSVSRSRGRKKPGLENKPGLRCPSRLSTINYLLTIVYFACGVRIFCETRSVIFAVTVYSPGSASLS